MRLFTPSHLIVQRAEPKVAVGDERTHAKLVGQDKRGPVVGVGLIARQWLTMRGNVAEEVQGTRLVASLLVCTGMCQRLLGEGVRLLQAARQQMRPS